jgi:hypothetical protein
MLAVCSWSDLSSVAPVDGRGNVVRNPKGGSARWLFASRKSALEALAIWQRVESTRWLMPWDLRSAGAVALAGVPAVVLRRRSSGRIRPQCLLPAAGQRGGAASAGAPGMRISWCPTFNLCIQSPRLVVKIGALTRRRRRGTCTSSRPW